MATFADMLSYLRKQNGLSQSDLAGKTGLTRSAIGMYETGKREPDFETLEMFADFFNVNIDTLLGRGKAQPLHGSASTTIGERIKARRKKIGMSAEQIAEQLNVSPSTVYRYENGDIEKMGIDKLTPIATALHCSPAYLLGYDVPMDRDICDVPPLPSNIVPLPQMKKVPLLGQIACGAPILAEQNITDYVDLLAGSRADFALICKGDSMINAGIMDGDIVFIRQQEEVENGQIAAVLIEDEATLKRFYHYSDTVQLLAENSAYSPLIFFGEEIKNVRVIGLAVAFVHTLR